MSLAEIVKAFKGKRVLVVGDVMLDQFIWGWVSRISPEAPVPVVEIHKETQHLGGAGNVASNIKALGGLPLLIGVIGRDEAGRQVQHQARQLLGSDDLVVDPARLTTVKTRIIAHNQQVCRADRECRDELSKEITGSLIDRFRSAAPRAEAVIISDYAKGVVTRPLLEEILAETKRRGMIVAIDPKLRNFPLYKGATVITPNQQEAELASGIKIEDEEDLRRAGRKLLRMTRSRHLLITRGEHGMTLFEDGRRAVQIEAAAREVFDVTGAGDTVISALTLALAAGAALREAAMIANHAAGIVVGKIGTAAVTPSELLASLNSI